MLLETILDDGQHTFVDEAADGVLHGALVVGEQAADVVEIEGVEHGGMIKGTELFFALSAVRVRCG
jgi:hypothetical protein